MIIMNTKLILGLILDYEEKVKIDDSINEFSSSN
jgi:hypothetical protein